MNLHDDHRGPVLPALATRKSDINSDAEELKLHIDRFLAMAVRQWRIVAASTMLFIVLGLLYILTAVPYFTASTRLLIDSGNRKLFDQMSAVGGSLDDDASVLSQVELFKSQKIAQAVSEKLNLAENNEFMAGQSSLLDNARSWARFLIDFRQWFKEPSLEAPKEQVDEDIVNKLSSRLEIERVGKTYVLNVSYSSPFPQLSADVARAYAEAYLTDQLDAKYEATRRASDWLQARIAELRQKSLETDMAVQKFKAANGLITTDGQLITDQQLTQLNSQLIIATADAANAQARLARIRSIIDSGSLDGVVTDSLQSSVINELQTKFLESSKLEADITSRLGEQHSQAVRLRNEMNEYRRLMFQELTRIAESYKSTFEVAEGRRKSLAGQVAEATDVSAVANDRKVELRELEREADTYKRLYETFLQRYQESIQQQSFPITEARIITKATVPKSASSPRKNLIMAFSTMLGVLVGAAVGAFREFRERFFRTGEEVRDELGLEFFGVVPLVANAQMRPGGNLQRRVIHKSSPVANYVVEHPLSSFAETLRSAKIAVDLLTRKQHPKVVGVVSALPGEGKSTVSINLAELLASQGAKVLLIDADLRNPGATHAIARHAERGILEALQDNASIAELEFRNLQTGLSFLPAVVKRRIPYSSELLSSDAMKNVLHQAAQHFEYVIIDLPPLAAVVDARAVSSMIDTFLLVVEWGRTSKSFVERTLRNNTAVINKCAGVVLNKVDPQKMKMYATHGSAEYYHSRYASYYRE